MSKHDAISIRMKENYESRAKYGLVRRMPVIIRIDGKAFHTYTRGLVKPFDLGLQEDLLATTIYLCENIQGAKIGYCQSDEISILVTDFDKLDSGAWFDYEVQKMCSISASLATSKFNQLRYIRKSWEEKLIGTDPDRLVGGCEYIHCDQIEELKMAQFDSRCFNVPREEVANYFLGRQNDAVRNSISMLAQSLYPHKELEGKNGGEMQEMCFQKGHNWNDLDFYSKRGGTVMKLNSDQMEKIEDKFNAIFRPKWTSVETPLKFNDEYFQEWLYPVYDKENKTATA